MANLLTRFVRERSGATAIEYGLIVSLIFLVVFGAMGATGASVGSLYQTMFGFVAAAMAG